MPFDPSYHAQSVSRVKNLVKQMSVPSATSFTAEVVPQAPEDALFGLMRAYRADENPNKVDLGIGAYRDDNAKPWVLPVVKHTMPFDPSYHAQSVSRVKNLVKQMSVPSATSFTAEVVPQAPEDALFGLMRAYRADENPNKVDLGIGAYRDDNAKPWVLPVVKTHHAL